MTDLEEELLEGLNIKEVGKEHAKILCDIEANDGYPYPTKKTPEHYIRYMDEGNEFYLATVDNKPVGYIAIKYDGNDDRHFARLHFIAVVKDYQGKKIGTKLINHGEEIVKQKKDKIGMYVVLYEKNLNAEKFYHKSGYNFWYFVPNRYEKGIGAKVLKKILNRERANQFYGEFNGY